MNASLNLTLFRNHKRFPLLFLVPSTLFLTLGLAAGTGAVFADIMSTPADMHDFVATPFAYSTLYFLHLVRYASLVTRLETLMVRSRSIFCTSTSALAINSSRPGQDLPRASSRIRTTKNRRRHLLSNFNTLE